MEERRSLKFKTLSLYSIIIIASTLLTGSNRVYPSNISTGRTVMKPSENQDVSLARYLAS